MILWIARSAVLLAAALAATMLMRRTSAATRHLVLLCALVGVLALPLLGVVAPKWRVAPAPVLVADGLPDAPPVTPVAIVGKAQEATAPVAMPRPDAGPRFASRDVALVVWVLGALVVLGRLAVGLVRAARAARRASSIDGVPEAGAIRDARDRLGGDVRISAEVDVPSVTGIFAPVILLPRAALEWSAERCRVVLMHEQAHVRRRDCLAQAVATIACALVWFNPLAWLAARRMRAERELAADEDVVAAGARASTYAQHLVAIAALVTRATPSSVLAMAQPSELERRVRAIVAARKPRPRPLVVAATVTGLAFAVACASERSTSTASSSVGSAAAAAAPHSTIHPELQAIADDEIARVMADWKADTVGVVILEPSTGAILAMAGRSPGVGADPLLPLTRAQTPASTIKPLLVAAALEEKTTAVDQRFFCGNGQRVYGPQTLRDHNSFGWLDVGQIIASSSNVGASRIFDTLGGERFARWLARFHFGERPPLEDAFAGVVPASIPDGFGGAVVALGEGVSVSQVQLAAAYAAIANGGVYNAPTLVPRAAASGERVLDADTARAVMALLERAVNDEKATGRGARIEGVRVAGKTGTAEPVAGREYATFVGIVPADAPRFVIVVGVEAPETEGFGGPKVGAPMFGRIAARALR